MDISALPEDAEMNAWHNDTLYGEVSGVPEPATVVLLGLGGLALLRRRGG